jgi:hypothetical protein
VVLEKASHLWQRTQALKSPSVRDMAYYQLAYGKELHEPDYINNETSLHGIDLHIKEEDDNVPSTL